MRATDDIPTGVKINMVARAVGKTRATSTPFAPTSKRSRQPSTRSARCSRKILVAGVPVVGVIAGGIVWALESPAPQPRKEPPCTTSTSSSTGSRRIRPFCARHHAAHRRDRVVAGQTAHARRVRADAVRGRAGPPPLGRRVPGPEQGADRSSANAPAVPAAATSLHGPVLPPDPPSGAGGLGVLALPSRWRRACRRAR